MTTTSWTRNSATDSTKTYTVTLTGYRWNCECQAFHWRGACHHVADVQKTLKPVDPGFLTAALAYAKLGYHVIPVEPGGKRPMVAWKDFQSVAPTIAQIKTWWSRTPNANVGLVITGNRMVVDLDGGAEAEALLTALGIELPEAPRSRTRSGFHVFLQAPRAMPDRIGLLKGAELAEASLTPSGAQRRAQIDVRGLGIIIAAPSVHPSGAIYTWLTPLTENLPMAPAALVDLVESVLKTKVVALRGDDAQEVFRVATVADDQHRLMTPQFSERGPAEAYADLVRRGQRKPEYRRGKKEVL